MLLGRSKRFAVRAVFTLLVGACFVLAFPRTAPAQDIAAAKRDVTDADDFRLRVSAALILGRTHTDGARPLLEQALSDGHPAVRTAAAAALAVLGDPAAIPALQRHAADTSASVKAQIQTAIATLQKAAQGPWQNARYVVQLGDMKNRTGIRGEQPSGILRTATRTHAAALPGAVISDGSDPQMLVEAANRHVPVLGLDGSVQRLTQGQKDSQLMIVAQVEFSLRRIPEQSLKGTLTGSATSIGSTSARTNPAVVAQLENEAIDGAVESAMRGAAQGFEKASK